jgi:DNA-binding PadR family transcriptional regulator
VLQALLASPEQWHYGYEISRSTRLRPGTLYPILARLAERGLLESEWEPEAPDGRPRRHHYRLSAAGVLHAARSVPESEPAPRARPLLGEG